MKSIKNKKKIILSTFCICTVIICTGVFIWNSLTEEKYTIENDIPMVYLDGIEVLDNEEILNRYENVNRKLLSYDLSDDPTMKNLSNPYFYESEQGFTLNTKENNQFKPINDKKYSKVLIGYSFVNIDEPMTKEEALDKSQLVLPKNNKQEKIKSYDEYDLVYYSSPKGEFVVYLGYQRIFNDKIFEGVNNERIASISYFKSI